ncbi:SDR family NAD(P)-dependent oxidoreductase [uncultured Methylovirgula sp.]|uniref:SDR family NAD(P)-dependent oxidoreductase n=1 Tax=uncultured Methylovirgula sp. TaxID=1285960 RepID=UPI0026075D05|nr:SDR family NAD(P)-dependent oxidoreductase [uncultured Methylovirgula sp.]
MSGPSQEVVAPKAPQRIVILGATSAIAEAAARLWAANGARIILAGRNEARLNKIAADLKARGASEAIDWPLDFVTADAGAELGKMVDRLGGLDLLLLAYGISGDQGELERNPAAAAKVIATNFSSAAAWSLAAAAVLEKQRRGTLLVIGSVAGDRGRRSNFIYGATKGGLAHLVEGIAHKLAPLGARAVIIKPGFVETPMTAGMANNGPLWAKPDAIAPIIVRAGEKGGPVVYAPTFWRGIMLIVRNLPAAVFDRLNI